MTEKKEVSPDETDTDQCPCCGLRALHFYDNGDMECHNKGCGYSEHADGTTYKWMVR